MEHNQPVHIGQFGQVIHNFLSLNILFNIPLDKVFGPVSNIQYPTRSERSVLLQIEQTQRLYGSNERVYPGPLAASEASA